MDQLSVQKGLLTDAELTSAFLLGDTCSLSMLHTDITLTLQRRIYHILPPVSDTHDHFPCRYFDFYHPWRECVKLKLIAQNVWQVHWSVAIMFSSFNVSVHQQTTVTTLPALPFHRKDDTRHHIYSTASHHGTADEY